MQTVVFDFDGTIADTFEAFIDIAYKVIGHPTLLNKAEVNELRNDSLVEVAAKLKVSKLAWPLLLLRGRKLMTQKLPTIKQFDGLEEVLKKLTLEKYSLIIMSNNSTENIRRFLTANNIDKYFNKVYGGIGLSGKSAALRKIIKQNKLSVADLIYVGDEVRDIEAAQNVDVKIIAVSWGFNTKSRLAKHNPTFLVDSPYELINVLNNLKA